MRGYGVGAQGEAFDVGEKDGIFGDFGLGCCGHAEGWEEEEEGESWELHFGWWVVLFKV